MSTKRLVILACLAIIAGLVVAKAAVNTRAETPPHWFRPHASNVAMQRIHYTRLNTITCPGSGKDCTGTGGDDLILGSDSGETIYGLGGRDEIYGNGGHDLIDGGSFADKIYPGPGGAQQNNIVIAGGGDDVVNATVDVGGGCPGVSAEGNTGTDTLWTWWDDNYSHTGFEIFKFVTC